MPIKVVDISTTECDKLLALHEGHFCELKATEVAPSKLTRTLAALSNAEGGEVYIGVKEDKTTRTNLWVGFHVAEDANGHIQTFEKPWLDP